MNHSTTLNFIITEDDEDNDIEVNCDIEWDGDPGSPAIVSGPPDNWEEADPGYFDIIKITVTDDAPEAKLKNGDEIQVGQIRETEEGIEEDVLNDIDDEPDCEPDDYDDYDDPAHDYIYG